MVQYLDNAKDMLLVWSTVAEMAVYLVIQMVHTTAAMKAQPMVLLTAASKDICSVVM